MIVLFHGHYPGHVVECHGANAEIGVVGDFADLPHEEVEVWCWDAVDACDEVGWGEAVLV